MYPMGMDLIRALPISYIVTMNDDGITKSDVLKILGISRPTLKRWIERNLFNITLRPVGSVQYRFFSRKQVLKLKEKMLKKRPGGSSYLPEEKPKK